MLRNAIDHGIEAPEVRLAAGKCEEGLVRVTARSEGGEVLIGVSDDGKGIDRDAVAASAVSSGLLDASAAAALSSDGIHDLLFRPGLSTAATVTDISGRGVGLDVVRANVARAGGEVSVSSEPGRYTRVDLRLPVRVSAQDVLLIRGGCETYALPLRCVRKTLTIPASAVRRLLDTPAIVSDGQVVPLLRLADLLGDAPDPRRSAPFHDGSHILEVVVLAQRARSAALLVEEIGRRQQVVVKLLDERLATPGISGASVLADGRIVLVLDAEALVAATIHATEAGQGVCCKEETCQEASKGW
jgi:two-component system chemotaxis sensor kinase CheA